MLVLPCWIEAQWQWFCFTCHMVALNTFEHMWFSHRLIHQSSKTVFFFQMCCDERLEFANSEPIQLSRLCLQPIQSVWACHVTAMALGWQAIIEDGFWKMRDRHPDPAPVASRFGFCPLRQEWKKLEANGFIRIFIQMRDDQVAWKPQLFLSSDAAVFLHVSKKHRTKRLKHAKLKQCHHSHRIVE